MSENVVTLDVAELSRELRGLRLPDPRRVQAFAGTIRVTGSLPPLQAVRLGTRPVLVDGFKRLEAAKQVGWSRIPVTFLDADAPGALVLLAQLNRHGDGLTALEEGWIVSELHRTHKWPLERIGALLGHDKSWACRREQLVHRLDPNVQGLLRQGGLDPAAAEELAALPRGNQETFARRAVQTHLSVREIRLWVTLWRQAPGPEHRRYLLDHPRETLALADGRPLAPDRWSELEALLLRILHQPIPPDPACAARLRDLIRQVQPFFECAHDARTGGPDSRTEEPRTLPARDRAPVEART